MMRFFYILLFITLQLATHSQPSSLDCQLKHSYVSQQMGEWGHFITQLDQQLAKSYSAELQFTRMKVRHLYIAHLLFNKGNASEISSQLKGFESDLRELEKNSIYEKHCIAFRSAYNAYTALNSPATAIYYLPKSFSYAKQAIKQYPDSPYSWSEYGNLEYCYRLFFGGSFSESIKAFSKSVELFEKKGLATPCNWYYINSLLFLAKSYEDNKQLQEANKVYDKILKISPDFTAIHRWKHKL